MNTHQTNSVDFSLIAQVRRSLAQTHLVTTETACLLAVSGGLDSVVLLHLFVELKIEMKLLLGVVHVNHGIRGEEADADQSFVEALATNYGLPFYTKRVDTLAYSSQHKLSVEVSARELRYGFFKETLENTKFEILATAHNKNDQAETIIDHFLRGSGSRGLRGMLPRRDCFIRPLLEFTRRQLHDYVIKCGLNYRDDRTNQDVSIRRNRIRHELLPNLSKHYNSNIIETLHRTGEIFAETETFLNSFAQDVYKSLVSQQEKNEIILDIGGFLNYTNLVKRYILIHCCRQLSLDSGVLSFNRLDKIISLVEKQIPGKKIELPCGYAILVDHDGLVFGKSNKTNLPRVEVDLTRGNYLGYGNYNFDWTVEAVDSFPEFKRSGFIEYFDLNLTGCSLTFRGFGSGDVFYPLKLTGKKKVSDFFTDKKIPLRKRARIPIIESPKGIVWICGHRIDDRFKITRKTKQVLKLSMRIATDEQ